MASREEERVELLKAIFDDAPMAGVEVGVGDDAAVLTTPREGHLVWTTDAAVEDVHFRRAWLSLHDLGYRSTMAAASDVAAMGGRVLGALAALTIPSSFADDDLAELARGQDEAIRDLGARFVGGNLSRGSELTITTTVLGAADGVQLRSGARPGDRLWLAGPVGWASAGLRALATGSGASASPALEACITAWRRPTARVDSGRVAASVAHALIDVSDGLALDLSRLLAASRVGARLEEAALLTPELEEAALLLGCRAIDLALSGGEDYALVAAAPPEVALEGYREIGLVTQGAGATLRGRGGDEEPLARAGFDHFG